MGEIKRLATLAGEINEAHRACDAALRSGLAHAMRAGGLLGQAKERIPHGQWGAWLRSNFEGSERTARAYMQTHRQFAALPEPERQRVADLSYRDVLKALAAPPGEASATQGEPGPPRQSLAELEARAEAGLAQFERGVEESAAALREWESIARAAGVRDSAFSRTRGEAAGWMREAAISLLALSDEAPWGGGTFDQSITQLEDHVRPIDLPAGRERFSLENRLTYRQMHQTIGELIRSGVLDGAPDNEGEEQEER